jgi:DNA-binding CsgD family transcriptional regulator
MAAEPAIDARMQAALARLTDNEKECLRRRLRQQTAKEMALDLGVSPHAVEKRLKMARTKLGLSSSLEAARLLVATEEYQRTGPQAADLHPVASASEKRFHRPLILGGLVMTLVTAAILALAAQSSSAPAGETKPDTFRTLPASEFVDGTPEELRAYAEDRFRTMDQDGSGFVERGEAPVPKIQLIETSWEGPGKPTREWIEEQQSKAVPLDPVMAKAAFISQGDANADGKLSLDEYLAMRNAALDAKQVPVSWREQRQARR